MVTRPAEVGASGAQVVIIGAEADTTIVTGAVVEIALRVNVDACPEYWLGANAIPSRNGATHAAVLGEAGVLSSTVSGGAKAEPSIVVGVDEPMPAAVVELITITKPVVVVTAVEGASGVLKAAR
ncbi:hypothetical protein E2562_028412 [Oryza meyeriana var. granulata]|uniref:Uncharacterized protein n=1 Tax=Oryza meyeriana var. granulata TaxID=110450 RepID=A0A6G1EQQ9_9ORYZ|nr:hypothetical protein E2562_028412 [Oryza meyeriana var. granulata]